LAFFLPGNPITGNVILEDTATCGALGCLELCDEDPDCGTEDMVCCSTGWDSGVCDYNHNCETIATYSTHQSLEEYQDTVREEPSPISLNWQRFFLPILVIGTILFYFAFSRDEK
ncbi:hypothetical protein GOV11_02825, partial [Candidatus Woesearchaeota archaeon]|nr:hypothetical protein [Candidatus Woesearchaeota archaeon]